MQTEAELDNFFPIAEQFGPTGQVVDVREYGTGNVNDTFLVTRNSSVQKHFILQRLNPRVFRDPSLVMQNMGIATRHLSRSLVHVSLPSGRRWEVPQIMLARNGRDHFIDSHGSFWRAVSFIPASRSFDTIQDLEHAREVGYALGLFQHLLNDLPIERLADPLTDFHITPRYLRRYDEVLATNKAGKTSEVRYGLRFIEQRRALADVLENAKGQGRLPLRPIHGDPKVSNVMLDIATGQAVSMVDLDTIKPGLVHYDIGDCLRSGCNPSGEETECWEEARFDSDLCRAILDGYLSQTRDFLTLNDYEYLYDAIRLIAFELGLRFFTDYLEGNVYFKVRHREHNLVRALVQFRLTASIEAEETAIRTLLRDLR